MARHLGTVAAVRHTFLTLALVGGTMAAVAGTPQAAVAAGADQLVVVDVNDATTSDFSASSLKTLNVDGTKSFAKPVDLPSADAEGVNAFALGGDSNGNGALSRSADGNFLAIGGYHHIPGATGQVKGTPPAPVKPKDTKTADSLDGPGVQRMVARIGNTGSVDTSTLLGTSLNTAHPRGVATDTGSTFYVNGNGGSTDTGVFTVPLGGGAKTAIGGTVTGGPTGDQRNTRSIQIADGGLYAVSEKNPLAGLGKVGSGPGLPTAKSPITRLGAVISTLDAATGKELPVPTAVVMLDAGAAAAGIDAAYVSFDTDDDGDNDEIRKYTTSDGTTWTQNGTKTGDYPFLTGRVSGGTVQLFASKGSGSANSVVKFDDTGGAGAASFGSDTTIGTAAAGHAFRGLALAPTSWDPGTISTDAPTASVANAKVGNTLGDAHNPGTTLTLADSDTDAADLMVEARSSNAAVISDSGIQVTGSGADRAVTFEPAGVGRANITFTVTDDHDGTGTAQVSYAASAAPESASGRYLYESSDLSSAVDVGDGHAIAVSSEDNKIRLYKKAESNRPVKEFDFEGDIGATNADLESMARANDTLYVLGSHGNSSKDGSLKPARDVMFTAMIGGSGADTTLTFLAKRTGLRDAIKAWDVSNGDALGFAAGQADGKLANEPDGFNIEGFELAPGTTTTGYLGMRAPVKNGKAILVPVTNLDPTLAETPTFGDPVFLDLGGRTVRDIRKNADDEYLISAHAGASSPEWKLFAWDGSPDHQAVDVMNLPAPDANRTGAWESIVSVPQPLTAGGSVTLIADSGDTTYYGDATVGAAESKGLRKSYIDEFTTSSYADYPGAPATVGATEGPESINVTWDAVSGATSYKVVAKEGANETTKVVDAPATETTLTGLSSQKTYSVSVAAVNASGTGTPTAGPDVTPTALTDRPSNVHWTSRTATSMKLAWTKKSGSAQYKIRYALDGTTTYKYLTVGDVSSANITGLSRGKSYDFKVAAIASNGTRSPYSSTFTASTSNLRAPANFVKKSRTATTITLTWTSAAGAEGYRVGYGIGSGARTYVDVTGGGTQSVKITGLRPGKSYTLDIASTELGGTSRSSYSPRITVATSAS